jgi:hypothetical protein
MPVRSFMKSDLAPQLLAGKRFAAFAVRRRYWRNNLNTVRAQAGLCRQARAFANQLADRLGCVDRE